MGYFNSIYSADLPSRAVSVYMYLKDRANKESQCYPAIGTIATELKLSRSTVKRAIEDLEKSSYLKRETRYREKGGKSSNLYSIF